ncbi:MAG TPA: Gfo/Idh/MocA family oxidoreductase [Pirellulales bacterium]|nr:Gfo/Idh/MocA family oxidoreductase [Pirellulales bacterium]
MPIKFGMLGMWHTHAHGMVRQIADHPEEFSLVGCHDSSAEVAADRLGRWRERLPELRSFDSAEALLREPLDAVLVEGQVFDNLGLARLALESGRPVMLEKPAGVRLDDFRRLVDLAQRKHLHVQMIYLFRYMPAVQELLARVRRGELGRLYEFRGRLPKDLASYRQYAAELQPYPGGMFFEMAGHLIDLLVALLGSPRQITPFLAHHHTQPPDKFIDNGVAIFGCDHSWAIVEVPSFEVAPRSRRVEVYGSEGACVIPHLGSGHLPNKEVQVVEVFRAGQPGWETIELLDRPLQISDLREFAAVVAGRKEPDYTLEHDLVVQESLLRAAGMSE